MKRSNSNVICVVTKEHRSTALKIKIGKVLKSLKCDHCDLETFNKKSLKKRIKSVHKGLKKYSCNNCYFKTDGKGDMERHRKFNDITVDLKKFQYELCPYETIYKAELKVHLDKFHELAKLQQ